MGKKRDRVLIKYVRCKADCAARLQERLYEHGVVAQSSTHWPRSKKAHERQVGDAATKDWYSCLHLHLHLHDRTHPCQGPASALSTIVLQRHISQQKLRACCADGIDKRLKHHIHSRLSAPTEMVKSCVA